MMLTSYRLVLELQRLNGDVAYREGMAPDWEPAIEWTRLAGLRQHGVWQQPSDPAPVLEPLWHATAGEPVLRGFRVRLSHDGISWAEDFRTLRYFEEVARAAATDLLAGGRFDRDERVQYTVSAYAVGAPPVELAVGFDTDEQPQTVELSDRGFSRTVAESRSCGDSAPTDLRVLVPEQVLEEVCALTRDAGDRETGGVLIGHLCRDDAGSGVGVEVTAQIPARHTVGNAVTLTFTSETWTDVRAAVALRGGHEQLIGWWHSHPAQAWCAQCPVERQRVCQLSTGFLSADDRGLHRTMFPGAYSLALVATNSISGVETKLFGWRAGVLEARGFHVQPCVGVDAGAAISAVVVDATNPRHAAGAACQTPDAKRAESVVLDAY